jgi:ferredoxin-NADP reductase
VFRDVLDQLAQRRGVTVNYVLGLRVRNRQSWLPESAAAWTDEDAMQQLVPCISQYDVYVCGPDQWMDAVCAAATGIGLPPNQLHQERFSW